MDPQFHLTSAKRLAQLLDSNWTIAGIKIGIDPLFDILPGILPIISSGVSFYIIYTARLFNVPSPLLLHMVGNIVIDYLLGCIPVLGFFGDIFFKSNLKNIKILEDYLQNKNNGGVLEGKVL